MYIENLALNHFRNYETAEIGFSKGINILYGDNAQGKTNVLEAIYMLATTKSHRGNHDKEIISFGEDEGHIRGQIVRNDISHRIDMHLRKQKSKGIAVDMVPLRKSADLFGIMHIILFSPEDLSIIKNGPSDRRRFMDMELCQLSRIYYSDLSGYNKVLYQRNNLLKQISYNSKQLDTLPVWDMQLTEYGKKVIKEREKFISLLNEIIPDIHGKLTEGKENLKVRYVKSANPDTYETELDEKRDSDIRYQTTQIGPHRDDMEFVIDDMDVKKYGSQGQQRTVALSLKLAEIELVRRTIDEEPVLLLDDVMSELDAGRRDALLASIKDTQTIITCTGYDDFIKERLSVDRIYRVRSGTIDIENALF